MPKFCAHALAFAVLLHVHVQSGADKRRLKYWQGALGASRWAMGHASARRAARLEGASDDAALITNRSTASACPLTGTLRPLVVGALGTSLTWGADLPDAARMAWPTVLQEVLQARLGRRDVFVLNGAMRATGADFAALCFDELWGPQWNDARGVARPPRLDLAIIEYNWSSSASQLAALIDALHARGVPSIGVLYYHPIRRIQGLPACGWTCPDKVDRFVASLANKPPAFGKHEQFAATFASRRVPYVNTSTLNDKHGWRLMLNTTRGILSAAHLTELGHRALAGLIADTLLAGDEACAEAFRLPALAAPPPDGSLASESLESSTPLVRAATASAASAPPPEYFCRIGGSLTDALVPVRSHGWSILFPPDGRTAGLVAAAVNATLTLSVPPPRRGRFLSLGFERSHRHHAAAAISCAGACVCAPITYDAHTSKKYTYLQRTSPRWVEPAIVTSGSAASCDVIVRATRLDAGRLMLKAVTMATPRAGNRSVSTSSLYALQ